MGFGGSNEFSNFSNRMLPSGGLSSALQMAINSVATRSTPSQRTLPIGNTGTIGGVQPPPGTQLPSGNDGTIIVDDQDMTRTQKASTSRLGGA